VVRSRHFHTEEDDCHCGRLVACGEPGPGLVANLLGGFGAYFAEPLVYWVSEERHDRMARNCLILVGPCRSPCCRRCTVGLEAHNHCCSQDEEIRAERESVGTFVGDTLVVGALLAGASSAVVQDVLHYQG